jgi:DNA-binding NtrC family response regulator
MKPVSIEALLVFLQKAVEKRPATASYVAPGATLREMERDAILRTLVLTGGSTVRAAKMLGISARKVQYRVKEYRQTEQLRHDESRGPADGNKEVA